MTDPAEVLLSRSAGWLPRPRLLAALAALLVVGLTLESVETFMRWRLPRRLDVFAGRMNPARLLGNVLQTAAFRAPAVLPIYGSSELQAPAEDRAEEFFLAHEEGFRVFPVGQPGNTCLLILEKLAAAGPVVRGKKVGIFLSPTWFQRNDLHTPEMQANITPVQLGAWMFGNSLSEGFKRRFARRLLEHSEALEREPMLTLGLRCLASDSGFGHLRFALLTPVGWLRNALLTRLDFCVEWRDLLFRPKPTNSPPAQAGQPSNEPLDEPRWEQLAEKAEARDRQREGGTPYSVFSPPDDGTAPERVFLQNHAADQRDVKFESKLDHSGEWTDLALLIDGLKELGAEPLFICQPFNGIYHDLTGHSARARRRFYDRLAEIVRASGFPLVDFSSHEEDKYFFNDANHPSAKAWIFYDHVLDDFYHGRGGFPVSRP